MTRKTYGYEPNYEIDRFDPYDIDPNIWQGLDNTCAIRSQEIILRDYGIIIPKDMLVKYATEQGWFDPDPNNGGTPKGYIGNLIDACGIKTVRTENATIYDIIAELRAGHRVIVSLDANELWVKNESNIFNRLFGETVNRVNDAIQNMNGLEGANHALVVAGVNVNPLNPLDVKVVLIDSGDGKVCIEYSLKDFQNAWADGHCQMVSTTVPAPYQYNYHTHQMEPSGFDTDFVPSMVELPEGLDNGFVLADSYFSDYEDFQPIYDDERVIEIEDLPCFEACSDVVDEASGSGNEDNSEAWSNTETDYREDNDMSVDISDDIDDDSFGSGADELLSIDYGNDNSYYGEYLDDTLSSQNEIDNEQ